MIGNKIKQLRKEKGYTQEQLAKILGLNAKSSIANYESGANSPSDDIKIKMCEIFNVSIDYLLGLTNIHKPIIFYLRGERMENFEKLEKKVMENYELRKKLYAKRSKENIDKSINDILDILNSLNLSIYETSRLVDLVKHIYEVERTFPQS